jgi:hypothetical protein
MILICCVKLTSQRKMGPDVVRSHLSMDICLIVNMSNTHLSRFHKTTVAAMARVAIVMTWVVTTARAATTTVRIAAATTVKTKPCRSLSGRLLLGSCGSSAPFVSRSMIPRPRWSSDIRSHQTRCGDAGHG